jgi:hypothetical protein
MKFYITFFCILLSALPVSGAEVESKERPVTSGLFGGSVLTNPNISLILNAFAYTSSLPESELKSRNISGHVKDGKKGFNIESAELFLFSPVDPYFNLYATIPVIEEGIELEEVYFVSTALPQGFQIKGGKFKSGFGRLNAQHPHAWDFVDSPIPYREFLGSDGLIEKGIQFTYLPELPFYTLLGAELLEGENKILFGPEAVSDPHAVTFYAKFSFDIGDNSTILFGTSAVAGKTKTDSVKEGTEFTGDSTLYGGEFTYKWIPSRFQSLTFQSEYLYRGQEGNLKDTSTSVTESLKRLQDGVYMQGLYQIERWRFGARYDNLNLFKDEYTLSGVRQDLKRTSRVTGSIDFHFTEFSILRLQYNQESLARGGINNEWFLQVVMGIGAHAAHPF